MNTEIYRINAASLEKSKNIILSGGVVAFPTETVYGLGANAFDTEAVDKIFEIKGRPNDNPLIVHVHPDYDISCLVDYIPEYAKKLAKEFLPGPLTMVYKSTGKVSPSVSCGLNTLAIRIPSHSGAQKFLKYVNLPVAAPSANISKHVSPVTAEHVLADLNGKIEVILDGGKCSGGIESTVLDCTGDKPVVLRSGLVTREMIASSVGECGEYVPHSGEKVKSPGMKYKHYAPRCSTELYDNLSEAVQAYKKYAAEGKRAYLLCDGNSAERAEVPNVLNLGKSEEEIASNLYLRLREGEEAADIIIGVLPEKRDGIMAGVINRFTKACAKK